MCTLLSAIVSWLPLSLQILHPSAQRVVAGTVPALTRMTVCIILLSRLPRAAIFQLLCRLHLRDLQLSLHFHLRAQYRELVQKRLALLW